MTTTVVRSACPHDCPDTCAMLTTVEDGRVIGVRGDPDHPFTRGALCAKVRNYEQRVHHPDRVLHPLRRTGAKGAGEFERITWETALDIVAERFTAIADTHGAEAILPCSYLGQQGLLNGLHCGDPFFNRLGASVAERTFCNAGATLAYNMTLGPAPGLDPQSFEHAKFIVIWACNIIGSMPHHWPFIRAAQKRGAKLVVIDPTRSRTASQADWHVRPRPGTDSALALAIAGVIIDESLHDADYVEAHVHGFDALRERCRSFTPARVEAITGVPADEIRALAREYAGTHPSAIRVGVAIERSANGPDAVRTISALPALVGAWRHVGGGIFQNSIRAFPIRRERLACPALIRPGTRVINVLSLGRALTGALELDPPIESLFVYNCNPVTACPDQSLTVEGLRREGLFTVVSEQFMTDTARFADIVLPATTQLEQFDLMYSWGQFHLAANPPAIEPLGEAVSNTELFRRLARRMGFGDPDLLRSDGAIARDALDWSHPSLDGITLERLCEHGWARLAIGEPDARAPHRDGGFPTPTGKCEIHSTEAAKGSQVLANFRQLYADRQEGAPLDAVPDYRAPAPGTGTLKLVSPKTHFFLNSCYANFDPLAKRCGPLSVTLHPSDAARRDITAGVVVEVHNEFGRIRALAAISDDTLEGVAVVPHGHWRDGQPGVNALNPDRPALLGKAPAFSDTTVEVSTLPPESTAD